MDVREKLVKQAISYFWYGVSHDIFSEPVTTYAKLAIEALEKENGATLQEWISVDDRLPSKEEYTAKAEDGTEYYARLLSAYKTDIVEHEIGYYDGYKWMTEMPIRLIKDVVAWMPFPNMPQPPKGE